MREKVRLIEVGGKCISWTATHKYDEYEYEYDEKEYEYDEYEYDEYDEYDDKKGQIE